MSGLRKPKTLPEELHDSLWRFITVRVTDHELYQLREGVKADSVKFFPARDGTWTVHIHIADERVEP